MAIIDDLGVSVGVHIDDTPMAEYDDLEPRTDPKIGSAVTSVCNKYIESKDDVEYTIVCEVWPRHDWLPTSKDNALSFKVSIDGKLCLSQLVYLNDTFQKKYTKKTVSGVTHYCKSSKRNMRENFKFGAIDLTDEADGLSVMRDLSRAKNLGTIRVEVWRVRKTHPRKVSHKHKTSEAEDLRISERALKGQELSHATGYSSPIETGPQYTLKVDTVDEHPYAVFNFKYRSKAVLQSEMIIPRPPSPTPAEMMESLSPDEIRKLALARLTDLKLKEEDIGHDSRGVKRQLAEAFTPTAGVANAGAQKSRKVVRLSDGKQAIDLTDD